MAKNPSKKTAAPALSFNPVALRKAVLGDSVAREAVMAELAKLAKTDDAAANACIIEARMIHSLYKGEDTDKNLALVRAILAQTGYKLDKKTNQPILLDSEGKPRRSKVSEDAYNSARQYAFGWFKRINVKRTTTQGGARTPAGKPEKQTPAGKPEKQTTAPIPASATPKDQTAFLLQAINLAASFDTWAHKNAKVSPPNALAIIAKCKADLEALAAL